MGLGGPSRRHPPTLTPRHRFHRLPGLLGPKATIHRKPGRFFLATVSALSRTVSPSTDEKPSQEALTNPPGSRCTFSLKQVECAATDCDARRAVKHVAGLNVPGQIPADPLVGTIVTQYEILAKLGGGGMGVVYRARDLKLGRLVALKFLPPQWSHDDDAKQRFIREAQAASATDHRNICTIHNIEHTDDGRLFIVMACYEGETLKQKLERGALPVDEALDIAAQIAEGLTRAHAQGVVHRDIKPANVMITDDGVKVLDFGLAKFADALQLTIVGSTVGTVAYMSPEQARSEEADTRSDIWAVAVVLYEMLAGTPPFKGQYPEAVFYAIKNEPPPPLRKPGRDIPEEVERLVFKALEKDPAARVQSVRELARTLRQLQGRTTPVDLRTEPLPPLPVDAARVRARRTRLTPVRVVAAAAALLLAAGAVGLWLLRPVERISIAIAPFANHTGDPQLDEYRMALTQALVADLKESPNIRALGYLQLIEILRPYLHGGGDESSREALQAITTSAGARFIVVPTLLRRDGTWLAQAEFRNVETATNVATSQTEAIPSSLPKDAAYRLVIPLAARIQEHFKANGPGRSYRARSVSSRPRSLDAARAFEQGLNAYEQLEYGAAVTAFRQAASEDPQHALTHAWLSRALLLVVQKNDAVESARRARQLVNEEMPRADVLFIDGALAESQEDFAAAEASYRSLGRLLPDDPAARLELADFLKRRGRNQEAIETYHEVLRLSERRVRPHVDLCQLYVAAEERPLAKQHGEAARVAYQEGGNRMGEAQALLCLGDALSEQGGARLAEAKRYTEQARSILETFDLPFNLARLYQYLGLIAVSENNYRAAAELFEAGLTRSRQAGNRSLEALQLMNLGASHYYLGNRGSALDYYRQSRDLFERIGDERRAAEIDVNISEILVGYGGDVDEARRRIAPARAVLQKLGYVDFELQAAQIAAGSEILVGRHDAARTELRRALNVARERQLHSRVAALQTLIARSHFLLNEYEAARTLLDEVLASEAGRGDPEAQVWLGRVYTRLGDPDTARRHLQHALDDIERTGRMDLRPLAEVALGELAFESADLPAAKEQYAKAALFWTEELTDPATVEARCYGGLLAVLAGSRAQAPRQMTKAGANQAAKMGQLDLEARCRLHQARILIRDRQYDEALSALDLLTSDKEGTLGPELRAEAHHWRRQAFVGRGDRLGAEAEAAAARQLIAALETSLPDQFRNSFASRRVIQSWVE